MTFRLKLKLPESALVWLHRGIPILFLVLVISIAGYELHQLDFHTIRMTLNALNPSSLAAVQLVAFVGMFVMGMYDWQVARTLKLPVGISILLRNAWIANSFNNVVGLSGMAASGIRLLLLTAQQVSTSTAAAFAGLIMLSVPVGLSVLSWPALMLTLPGTEQLPVARWVLLLVLGIFALYLPVYAVVLHRGSLKRITGSLPPLSLSTLAALIAISTLDWLFAAATAWLAVDISGASIPWMVFLTAFVLACTLGIASLIPGGLGVFDAALFMLLAPATDKQASLISGILVYRLCYFLVPWFIGLYLGAGRLMATRTIQYFALEEFSRENRWLALLRPPLNLLASLGVRVLAYLTFFAGVILLVSAAFPALVDRFSVLHDFVPLGIIELSHLLSVATGVLLIALSRGIAGQVRIAYRLTLLLLLAGVAFSLLKGIDYEEAVLLAGIALLLRLERQRFYRTDFPLFNTRKLRWLVGLVFAVIGFAWLGDWVHGTIPFGWERLSHFAAHAEAPRFARSLLVAAIMVLIFLSWTLFRRPPVAVSCADAEELAEAQAVLERYGGTSFSQLVFLGDKRLFWSTQRDAFIQYGLIRDRMVALGDPCGNADASESLVLAFREYADRHSLTACFYEVEETALHRYHDAGFALFKLGEAALVDVNAFTLSGKPSASLRHSFNRAKREGVQFQWLKNPLSPANWQALRAVSDDWLRKGKAVEKAYSLGVFSEVYLARSDIAVVTVNERIVAFASLMPDYTRHRELSIDLMRHNEDAPTGTMDYLFVNLIEYAKEQNYTFFNLGMAPLSGVGDSPYARRVEKIARLAYEYGNRYYHYKGLRSFKEKFHPQWRSSYLAYPILTPLPALLVDIAALIAGSYRHIFFRTE